MMADKGKRGVVGVAEPVLFDKNDVHAPEGVAASDLLSCYAPVCRASRPAADFLASGSVTSFFHPLIRVRPDCRTWPPRRSCGSRRNSLFHLLAEASVPAQCGAMPCVVDDICSSGLPVTRSASSSTLTFGQSFPLLSPGGGVWF